MPIVNYSKYYTNQFVFYMTSPHPKLYSMISGKTWTIGGPKMRKVTLGVSSGGYIGICRDALYISIFLSQSYCSANYACQGGTE
jgi:hypothetical protein